MLSDYEKGWLAAMAAVCKFCELDKTKEEIADFVFQARPTINEENPSLQINDKGGYFEQI